MKVLFYISTIGGGGAARVMVNVANGIAEKGHEVCFVTNFAAEHEYALHPGICRFNLEKDENKSNVVMKNMTRIKALRRVLKQTGPDVSVAFMGENNFRLLIAAKGLPTKTVVSVRNDPAREYPSKLIKKMANVLYTHADGLVFQTEDARAAFPEKVRQKSRIIFNQVDESFFYENYGPGEFLIACGRLNKQKNIPMLLKAFASVAPEHPDAELRIYGEGPLKDELIAMTKRLGIESAVRFMGFSGNMSEVYKQARLLLLSSDYEGLPNVMLEALASSVPVVSTDCPSGGPRMIIRNGENGYLVSVGDDREMADRMNEILSDTELYTGMRKNAYRTAAMFRPEQVLEEWTKMIVGFDRDGRSN